MVLAWRNHPEVRSFMFTQHEINLEEHIQWFNRVKLDKSRSLLIVQEEETPIGYIQFSNVEPGGVADWGFYARPNAEKGNGKKLGTVALEYAFGNLELHKVCGQAIVSNHASIRFHERLGFKREAELREQKRIGSEYKTLICFGLLASEWTQIKKGITHETNSN